MFAEKTIEILKNYVKECHQDNVLAASKALGIPNDTLSRWLKGEREPGIFRIGGAMDVILQSDALPEKICNIHITYTPKDDAGNQALRDEIIELKKTLLMKQGEINALERLLKPEVVRPRIRDTNFIEDKTA